MTALVHCQTQSDDPISCYGNSCSIRDFFGPLHWFPFDQIVGLSPIVDRVLTGLSRCFLCKTMEGEEY